MGRRRRRARRSTRPRGDAVVDLVAGDRDVEVLGPQHRLLVGREGSGARRRRGRAPRISTARSRGRSRSRRPGSGRAVVVDVLQRRGVTPAAAATSAYVPESACRPRGPTSSPPSSRRSGAATVAMPAGSTRSRMVPLAAYCGPASSSSATPCRAVRVRVRSTSAPGRSRRAVTRREGTALMTSVSTRAGALHDSDLAARADVGDVEQDAELLDPPSASTTGDTMTDRPRLHRPQGHLRQLHPQAQPRAEPHPGAGRRQRRRSCASTASR